MVHPCEKPCYNKTASGYCATTACINSQFSNIGTAQYGQGDQKRIVTNADKLRAMSDEELAEWLATVPMSYEDVCPNPIPKECNGGDRETCIQCWLDWLKKPETE